MEDIFGGHKGTKLHEPGEIETLYMTPSYHAIETFSQTICIAPVRSEYTNEGCVSLVCMKSNDKPRVHTNFAQFWLTVEEVEIVIKALQEALDRLESEEESYG